MRSAGDNSAQLSVDGPARAGEPVASLAGRIIAVSEWLWAPPRRTRALLAFGLVAAVIAGFYLWAKLPSGEELPIQGNRDHSMAASINLMNEEGAPPLLKRTPEASLSAAGLTPPSYDSLLAGGDDTGVYVYVPVLASWLDLDVPQTLKLLLLLFLIPVLYYPLVFYRLTGSALAAFAAPILLVGAIVQHTLYLDLYWVQAWAILALLPLILLAWLRRDRWGLALLVPVMLASAVASTFRGGAGIGIALAAVAVVALCFKAWSRLQRAGAIAALIAVYLAISPGAMTLFESNALAWAGDDLYEKPVEGNNSFFHIAFIGLGYQPNDWSIYYRDEIANAWAQRESPGVPYLSSDYNSTLRGLFFDRVGEDPGFFASLVGKKLAVSLIATGLSTLLFVALAARFLLVAGPDRRLMLVATLIALPSIVIGLAPGLLAIPQPQYVFGSTGAFAFLEIVIWSLALLVAGRWLAPRARAALAGPGSGSAAGWAVLLAAGGVAILAVVSLETLRWAAVAALTLAAVLSLASAAGLRDRPAVALSRRSVGVAAALATLALLAVALPVREVANDSVDSFYAWDTDLEGIEQAVSSIMPASQPDTKLQPAS